MSLSQNVIHQFILFLFIYFWKSKIRGKFNLKKSFSFKKKTITTLTLAKKNNCSLKMSCLKYLSKLTSDLNLFRQIALPTKETVSLSCRRQLPPLIVIFWTSQRLTKLQELKYLAIDSKNALISSYLENISYTLPEKLVTLWFCRCRSLNLQNG